MSQARLTDFRGGVDRRKFTIEESAGTLYALENGHVTPVGQAQKRKAFVPTTGFDDTFGFQELESTALVFGSDNLAASFPITVGGVVINYQRLQHPDPTKDMTAVLHSGRYEGYAWVIAQFSNGDTRCFYNGTLVADFTSGLVTALLAGDNTALAAHLAGLTTGFDSFSSSSLINVTTITSPAGLEVNVSATKELQGGSTGVITCAKTVTMVKEVAGQYTSGQFSIQAGTELAGSNRVVSVRVGTWAAGIELMGPTYRVTSRNRTGGNLAELTIGAHPYIIGSVLDIVNVTNAATGDYNGNSVVVTAITATTIKYASVGTNEGATACTDGHVTLHTAGGFVDYNDTPEITAAAVADAINAYTATSGFNAAVSENTVFVYANAAATTHNGKQLSVVVQGRVCVGENNFMLKHVANAAIVIPSVTKVLINGVDVLDATGGHYGDITTGAAADLNTLATYIAENITNKISAGMAPSTYVASALANVVSISRRTTTSTDVNEEVVVQLAASTGGVAQGTTSSIIVTSLPNEDEHYFTGFANFSNRNFTTPPLFSCLVSGGAAPYSYEWSIVDKVANVTFYTTSVTLLNQYTANGLQIICAVNISASALTNNGDPWVRVQCKVTDAAGRSVTSDPVKLWFHIN